MELSLIVLGQTVVMFLLMGCGVVLAKTGKLTDEGSVSLGNLLLYLVIPSAIISSFPSTYSGQVAKELGWAALLSLLGMALTLIVARVCLRKDLIGQFGAGFSNAGFIGIPIVQATLGAGAVLYIAPYIAILNVLQWTYGVHMMTKGRVRTTAKKLLTNPILISIVLALLRFFLSIPVPAAVDKVIGYFSALNAPIAMLVLGVYLARVDCKAMLTSRAMYYISAVRLVVAPLIAIGLFRLMPFIPMPIRLAMIIAVSAPVGSNVVIYTRLNGLDTVYATQTVVLSTLLSIITLPLAALLAAL